MGFVEVGLYEAVYCMQYVSVGMPSVWKRRLNNVLLWRGQQQFLFYPHTHKKKSVSLKCALYDCFTLMSDSDFKWEIEAVILLSSQPDSVEEKIV